MIISKICGSKLQALTTGIYGHGGSEKHFLSTVQ